MADLTREGQARGNGIDGLAGIGRLPEAFRDWLLGAYLKPPLFHGLGPARRKPKLGGPGHPLPPIEVYFSPNGGCTDAIVREIHDAKSSILVQAYSFTSRPIAKPLASAKRPGMRIEVILDATGSPRESKLLFTKT